MVGGEANTAWNAVNWIYGDSVNTNPSVTSFSWANYNGVGNAPVTNYNQMLQNAVLNYNNSLASAVPPENRLNSTYVDKNYKIIDVDTKDRDLGVYVDNQDGGTRKDLKVGKTEYIDEFVYPDGKSKGLPTKGYEVKVDKSIDSYIERLAQEGGGSVSQNLLTTYNDLKQLAKDSYPGKKFDIKTSDKLGAYNGYLLNGNYVSGRSAGNYLAGLNAAEAKPWVLTNEFWLNETLSRAGNLHNSGAGGKEIPYSERRIIQGYEAGKK